MFTVFGGLYTSTDIAILFIVLYILLNILLNVILYPRRYVSAKAKGRADLDWSAIGMDISEDAGIDVSKDLARNKKDVLEGNTY